MSQDWVSLRCREMGLWTLLEGFLLLANALAILNEDRFLAPRGWGLSDFSGGRTKSFKGQILGLIYATQYLRVPLILLNSICIFVKLVSGQWIMLNEVTSQFQTFFKFCMIVYLFFKINQNKYSFSCASTFNGERKYLTIKEYADS